ncbi:MAG: GntR family transcriptional regulator [Pseudomonadota bacterium]
MKRASSRAANDVYDSGDVEEFSFHPGLTLAAGTQSSKAYALIRRRIVKLELAPGAPLSERELIEETGLGRTPVREALLRLAVERLIVSNPGKGLQVAPIGLEEVRDIYEVRLQEDRLAGRLFLQNADAAQLDAVVTCFDAADALVAAGDFQSVFNLDFRFHALFYAGAGNSVLSSNHHLLVGHYYRIAQISAGRRREAKTVAGLRALVDSHEAMVEAVRHRDAGALDKAIVEHTTGSLAGVIEVLTGLRMAAISDLNVNLIGES